MNDLTGTELVGRLRAGDGAAAEQIVREYAPQIRRRIRLRLTDYLLLRVVDSGDICPSIFDNFLGVGDHRRVLPREQGVFATSSLRWMCSTTIFFFDVKMPQRKRSSLEQKSNALPARSGRSQSLAELQSEKLWRASENQFDEEACFTNREKVAEVGFAGVYRVWDSQRKRFVATKISSSAILDEESQLYPHFQREAESAALLSHPSVVEV